MDVAQSGDPIDKCVTMDFTMKLSSPVRMVLYTFGIAYE